MDALRSEMRIDRLPFLAAAAPLLLFVGAGCGVPSTTTDQGPKLTSFDAPTNQDCGTDWGAPARSGTAVTIGFRGVRSKQRCHCQYVTSALGDSSCESEYDLGGPNPQVCDDVSEAESIVTFAVYSKRPECSASFVRDSDPSAVHVQFSCPSAGESAFVLDATLEEDGDVSTTVVLEFTPTGACP
jgi:hypothetical protein